MEIKFYPWYPASVTAALGLKRNDNVSPERDSPQGGFQEANEEPANPFENRNLTDEEFKKALEKLTQVKGYREANLAHRVEINADGQRIVLILDPQQNEIKRLTERELGAAFLLREVGVKGTLLNKRV